MAKCNIVPFADNGKESKVFQEYYTHVPREEAIELYSLIHSVPFLKWFGDWKLANKVKNNIPLDDYEFSRFTKKHNQDISVLESTLGQLDENGEPAIIKSSFVKGEDTRNIYSPLTIEDIEYSRNLSIPQLEEVLSTLSAKFGNIPYKIINDKSLEYKGKFDEGIVTVNAANFSLDTPFHEFGHIFLEVIKQNNKSLYNNLKLQILNTELGQSTLERIANTPLYKENSENDIIDEAIVQLLGEAAGENYLLNNEQHKDLKYYLDTFFKRMSDYFKTLFKANKSYTANIPPNTTIMELGAMMNLKNPIEVTKLNEEYVRPLPQKYNTREVYLEELQKAKEKHGERVEDIGYNEDTKLYSFLINEPITTPISFQNKTFYQATEPLDALSEAIKRDVEKMREFYKDRKRQLEQTFIDDPDNKIDTENAIKGIEALNIKLDELDEKEQFVELLTEADEHLRKTLDFLSKPENFKKSSPALNTWIIQATQYIRAFKHLDKSEYVEGTPELEEMVKRLNKDLPKADRLLMQRKKENAKNLISQETTNTSLLDDPELISKLLEEAADIDIGTANLLSLADSKDTILQIANKIFQKQLIKVQRDQVKFIDEFTAKHDNLIKLSGNKVEGAFDFMLNLKNGTIVNPVSDELGEYKDALYDDLRDKDGELMQYIPISGADLKTATPEEIAHNKMLFEKKGKIRDFLRAEVIKGTSIVDGENYRYSQEFKDARAKYEEYIPTLNMWDRKPGVSDKDWYKYVATYYGESKTYYKPIMKQGVFTGAVELDERRYVKGDYIRATNKWIDERYKKIQLVGNNNPTKLQLAQKEYYNFYVTNFDEMTKRLPKYVANNMKGRMIPLEKDQIDSYYESENKLKFASKYVKNNFFTPSNYLATQRFNEKGQRVKDIPIWMVQSLKDNEKIAQLENEIDEETDPARKKELAYRLSVEVNKLNPEDITTNISEALIEFNRMSLNYKHKKAIESTIHILKDIIRNRKYFKKDSNGNFIKDEDGNPTIRQDKTSLIERRLDNFYENIFLEEGKMDKSTVELITSKVRSLASVRGLGLNPMSGLNNYLVGRILQHIETQGEQYYKKESGKIANKRFNEYMRSGLFVDLGGKFRGGQLLEDSKPKTKMAAFLKNIPFLQDQTELSKKLGSNNFSKELMSGNWMFILTHIGEFANQVRVGLAIMEDTKIKDKYGNEVSLWDAYDDNFKLKEGFTVPESQIENLVFKMRQVNAVIHGRYNEEEASAWQAHWLGKMAYHFRKWMPNYYLSRFGDRHHHEGVESEIEGRYRTYVRFLKSAKDLQWNLLEAYRTGDKLMQANMLKNMVELGYFAGVVVLLGVLSELADNIDPDDDEVLNKMVNFLHYQDSRLITELTAGVPVLGTLEALQLLKNPIAATSYLEAILEVMFEAARLPYNYLTGNIDDSYYSKGTFKGQLKLGKEFRDMFPLLVTWNRWQNFDKKQEFYIK